MAPENGVGDGVQRARRRRSGRRAREHVRNRDAAEPDLDRPPRRRGHHSPVPCAYRASRLSSKDCPRARNPPWRGELEIARIAREIRGRRGRQLSAIMASSVNSSARDAAARCAFRIKSKAKGLRRLHGAQPRPLGRRDHRAGGVDLLDRVGERHARRRRAVVPRGVDRAGDQRRVGEGPGGVVDQHDFWRLSSAAAPPARCARSPAASAPPMRGRGQNCFARGGGKLARRWRRKVRGRRRG